MLIGVNYYPIWELQVAVVDFVASGSSGAGYDDVVEAVLVEEDGCCWVQDEGGPCLTKG